MKIQSRFNQDSIKITIYRANEDTHVGINNTDRDANKASTESNESNNESNESNNESNESNTASDSKQAQSELYYINKVTGGIKEPTFEEIVGYAEKYGFPIGADGGVLYIAYTYGKHFLEQGEKEAARYFLGILYELTQDERVREMLPPNDSSVDREMNV